MLAYEFSHNANSNLYRSTNAHSNLGMSPWKSSVLKILNHYQESPQSLDVSIDHQPLDDGHADKAILIYSAQGEVKPKKLIEAVHMSLAHFGGATHSRSACTVQFRVELNGVQIGKGETQF